MQKDTDVLALDFLFILSFVFEHLLRYTVARLQNEEVFNQMIAQWRKWALAQHVKSIFCS